MKVLVLSADHEGKYVVIKSTDGKLAWLEPEDAISLAQKLMDAAGLALLNASNE